MIPLFTFPLAAIAAVGLPGLVASYVLRTRFRRQPVSSLMLWVDQRRPREGGSMVERLRVPWLFLLECLVIALLVLAAMGPRMMFSHSRRPLAVILDDSYSMTAAGADSPHHRAAEALRDELDRRGALTVYLVLAGEQPRLLGEPTASMGQVERSLGQWQPTAPRADLSRAMALGAELAGPDARLLVLTDQSVPEALDLAHSRARWWAFGTPRPNVAIINAICSPGGPGQRVLLEVANLAQTPTTATLRLSDSASEPQLRRFTIAANAVHRLMLDLPADHGPLHAGLAEDPLALDNHVTLLPAPRRPVRVELRIADPATAKAVDEALSATGQAVRVTARGALLITDDPEAVPTGTNQWPMYLRHQADEPVGYVGPFVMDRSHPLTNGLSLAGSVWAAGSSEDLPGTPVIAAGNTPLLTDLSRLTGRHDIYLRLSPQQSTLPQQPAWPILFYNLLQWRSANSPGLLTPNVRLGTEAHLTLPNDLAEVALIGPDGLERQLATADRQVALPADQVGIYQVQAGEQTWRYAVNALRRDESDLSAAVRGRWGDWVDDAAMQQEYQPVAWAALLGALALMAGHAFLLARAGRAGGLA